MSGCTTPQGRVYPNNMYMCTGRSPKKFVVNLPGFMCKGPWCEHLHFIHGHALYEHFLQITRYTIYIILYVRTHAIIRSHTCALCFGATTIRRVAKGRLPRLPNYISRYRSCIVHIKKNDVAVLWRRNISFLFNGIISGSWRVYFLTTTRGPPRCVNVDDVGSR